MGRRTRGAASVYEDTSKQRWVAAIDLGNDPETGKRRRVKRLFATRSEALAEARRLTEQRRDLIKQVTPDSKRASLPVVTFGDLTDKWLARSTETGRQATFDTRRNRLIKANRSLNDIALPDLRTQHFEAAWHDVAHLTWGSLGRIRSHWIAICKLGVTRGDLAKNWAEGVVLPPRHAVVPDGVQGRRALSPAEASVVLARIRDSGDISLYAWISLSMLVGLRPGEINGLLWEAIDLDKGLVTVSRQMVHDELVPYPKTEAGYRTLEVDDRVVEALAVLYKWQGEQEYLAGPEWPSEWSGIVFRSSRGTPYNLGNLRRKLSRLLAGLPLEGKVRPYDFRHTAATLLAQVMDMYALADFLGHANTRMVQQYYRHRTGTVRNGSRELGSLIA